MIKNIKEVNQNLLEQGINKLPLEAMDIQGFKKIYQDKKLTLENDTGKVILMMIKGSDLHNYILVDKTKDAILNLFKKISSTEEKYQNNPVKLETEVEKYSEQLPPIYKKLEETHWVIAHAANESVISELILTINNEVNNLKRPKLK